MGNMTLPPEYMRSRLHLGILHCIRAIGGYTTATSADTAFDTYRFREQDYLEKIRKSAGNLPLVLNWYNSMKVSLWVVPITRH